uniref:phosphoglycerate mutase (2,3-diphosphoglycerate-independent) n=1 Tax=Ditylenchus dipsaci TaxID=166011 RepID=A0A915ECU3_9BILA
MENQVKNKVCLIVIDGWGISEESHGNAILNANTPVMDQLCSGNWQQIEAHEHWAGRVIYQDIVRINLAVKDNTLVNNEQLKTAAKRAVEGNGRLHLLGLVSDGGVHSHIDHLFGLVKAVKQLNVPHLYVHFFGDGRDTSPTSGAGFLEQTLTFLNEQKYGELGTIVGRYYAMDRDKRWERIKVAYEALIAGHGEKSTVDKAVELVKSRYANNETDEFLKPIVFSDEARIKALQRLGLRCASPEESAFEWNDPIQRRIQLSHPVSSSFPCQCAGRSIGQNKVSQFHCAETEKYAHVTFFFNGGQEKQFEGEERCMVPSPKVATYDLQPEMSAAGVAEKMIEQVSAKKHPFIMCNFAPPDMVGHTGVYEAAIKACEATDVAIGQIFEACKQNDYIMLVTADHGNAEKMIDENGGKFTAHTNFKVPFTCSSNKFVFKKSLPDRETALRDCTLDFNVALTPMFENPFFSLHMLGLEIPAEMDGVSLVDEQ